MAPSRLYYLRKKLLWSELGGPLCQRTVFLWIDVGVVDVLMEGLDRGRQILTLSPVHQPPTNIHRPNPAIRKLPLHLVHPSPDDRAHVDCDRHCSPVPAFIPSDIVAETRGYEAAQGQRRVGNYQGAIVAFQNFLAQYPKSNLAPRAQYWIGDSYFNLADFKLAIAAQQTLVKTYPDSATVPDAMLNIASSQIEMGETIAGKKSLEEILQKFPISEAAGKAKRRLAAMSAVSGAPAAKQ